MSGTVTRDPVWSVNRRHSNGDMPDQGYSDSVYFARTDSLVIDAIEQSYPALLKLATTETPYVAIAVTERNKVVAHSIGAGSPVRDTVDAETAAVRRERAAAAAGLPPSARNDADFKGRMGYLVNDKNGSFDDIGISHLKVHEEALTVLWVRFRENLHD